MRDGLDVTGHRVKALGTAYTEPRTDSGEEDVAPGDSPCMIMRAPWRNVAIVRRRHDDSQRQPANVLDTDLALYQYRSLAGLSLVRICRRCCHHCSWILPPWRTRSSGPLPTSRRWQPIDPSWPVTLHFHPDRLVAGVPILQLMARDGVYRSQFETAPSNGGLTAHPGGDRWRWESRIFAGAYDDGPATDRPKYGSLNFRRRLVGGSPRFGSAYLRFGPHTVARTTFCYPDSVFEPEHFGVASRLSTLAVLAQEHDQDRLDDYVEAQVHGVVDLTRDIEALDPCYRGTLIQTAARRLACPIQWHSGFALTTTELRRNPSYRGLEFVDLGVSLARHGRLNPRIIGDASRTGRYDEQALKRVWHYVARFGSPKMRALTRSSSDSPRAC